MSIEKRVERLILKANENDYNRDTDERACIYWYGNQQYFDHDFAKAFWGEDNAGEWESLPGGLSKLVGSNLGWKQYLVELVLVSGDQLAKLDYLEKFL